MLCLLMIHKDTNLNFSESIAEMDAGVEIAQLIVESCHHESLPGKHDLNSHS